MPFNHRYIFQVYVANDYESLECITPVERTQFIENPQASNTNKVTCKLPPRGTTLGSTWYTITMYVDSKKVPNTMGLNFNSGRTPRIETVTSNRQVKHIFWIDPSLIISLLSVDM